MRQGASKHTADPWFAQEIQKELELCDHGATAINTNRGVFQVLSEKRIEWLNGLML